MRRLRLITTTIAIVFVPLAGLQAGAASPIPVAEWAIDPAKSEVRFTITKFGFEDVTGVFRESEGVVRYDPARPAESAIRWRVRVASVLTDATNRDRSLQGPDYFDAARFPFLSFESRAVRPLAADRLEVSGDITIRGVTRPLTITVRPRAAAAGPVFESDFEINRYDFGVVGGTILGRLIGRRARVHVVAATIPVPPAERPAIR